MVGIVKVSSKSNPSSVAGAVAAAVREAGTVEVQVVGAGALNQAIKALAIARGYVAPAGLDLVCRPTFTYVVIDGKTRTAIRLTVEREPQGGAPRQESRVPEPQAATAEQQAGAACEARPSPEGAEPAGRRAAREADSPRVGGLPLPGVSFA